MKIVAMPPVTLAAMSGDALLAAGAGSAVDTSSPYAAPSGHVMAYTRGLRGYANEHEQMTRMEVVRRLAALKGFGVIEEFAQEPVLGSTYLVPSDTLVGTDLAQALGVKCRDDLFGGVVPHGVVATKAITHPLLSPESAAPEGWSHEYGPMIRDAVLRGFSAFSRADAREAARRMLAFGPARIKRVRETGGRGQFVCRSMAEVDACLQEMPDAMIERDGVVVEQNLSKVETLSVGQVWVAGMLASYFGYQKLTTNNRGEEAYGGSDLTVVRGDFHTLLAIELPHEVRVAVGQALAYNAAVSICFPQFFASRINYDVAQGFDEAGAWHSGVLEQSWRAGGATGAEIAALEAFRSDPERRIVRACCTEIYGTTDAPEGSVVYFSGVDQREGPLTKFTTLVQDGHSA
ncbi:DUF3182 family protein [Variovorax sp. VNK109]|uniref:DUF3182 family protein n=1 Tax=Variovorax sp. VNK109 TaxID=3400919 RepID=UPI003C01F31A